MNLRLSFADAVENGLRALLDRGIERGGLNQAFDLTERAVSVFVASVFMAVTVRLIMGMLVAVMMIVGVRLIMMIVIVVVVIVVIVIGLVFVRMRLCVEMHIKLSRRNAAAINALDAEVVSVNAELGKFPPQEFKVQPAIQQCADQHIAARARKTVEIKCAHLQLLSRPAQGMILTGVLTGSLSKSSLMSGFSSAMQPSVQSRPAPPPWIKMSPPSGVFCGGLPLFLLALAIA